MAKIKRVQFTEEFSKLNQDTQSNQETNDCSVKAVALVCGIPYEEARKALAKRGRAPGRGAYTTSILDTLEDLGKRVSPVNKQEIIAKYPSPHNTLQNITTHHPRRFPRAWPMGTYLLFVRRHVAAVVDGKLHDWTVNTSKHVLLMYLVD